MLKRSNGMFLEIKKIALVIIFLSLGSCGGGGGSGSNDSKSNLGKTQTISNGMGNVRENSSVNNTTPVLKFDSAGNAMALWVQNDIDEYNVWSNYFTPSTGWNGPELIETNNNDFAFNPQFEFDGAGNVIATWHESNLDRYNLWANRFTPENGWDEPQLIEFNEGDVYYDTELLFDNVGNAIVMWRQSDEELNLWTNYFSIDNNSWQGAEVVDNSVFDVITNPKVAFDNDGNYFTVWKQLDIPGDLNYSFWFNRFTPSNGWGNVQKLADGAEHRINNLYKLAVNPESGDGTIVWIQAAPEFSSYNMYAKTYSQSGGLSSSILIDSGVREFFDQTLIDLQPIDGENYLLYWKKFDGDTGNIWSSHYNVLSGWRLPEKIQTSPFPQTQINPVFDKNIVLWSEDDGDNRTLWVNEYHIGDGWNNAFQLEEAVRFRKTGLVRNNDGSAFALWVENSGTFNSVYRLYGSMYTEEGGWEHSSVVSGGTELTTSGRFYHASSDNTMIVIWEGHRQGQLNSNELWGNIFSPQTGWSGAKKISSTTPRYPYSSLQVDNEGNAIFLWVQRQVSSIDRLWTTYFGG